MNIITPKVMTKGEFHMIHLKVNNFNHMKRA